MDDPKSNNATECGQRIFKPQVEAHLLGENPNGFLAIDILSGDYEIGPDDPTPSQHLRVRHLDAVIFLRRLVSHAAYSVGGG